MPGGRVTVDHLCGVENLTSAQGAWSYHVAFKGKAPTRQLHSIPTATSGSSHTRKQINLLDAVIHIQVRLKSCS